jgi:hypothetical protein
MVEAGRTQTEVVELFEVNRSTISVCYQSAGCWTANRELQLRQSAQNKHRAWAGQNLFRMLFFSALRLTRHPL